MDFGRDGATATTGGGVEVGLARVAGLGPGGAPWIRRLALRTPTLPPATHTNAYVIGEGKLVLVEPASPYPEEQARLLREMDLLAAGGEQIEALLLTHHHADHVGGARALAEARGLPVLAHRETAARLAGRLTVDRLLEDGDELPYGPSGIRVVHTPGHAPGHLCFLDHASRALLAGDMVAGVGTIVIEPHDGGDMAAYLEALARMRQLGAAALLPAHGPPTVGAAEVDARLGFYVAHRLGREAKVLAALAARPRTLEALLVDAYPEVPSELRPLAARSLLAHLIKLEREGRAAREGEAWLHP